MNQAIDVRVAQNGRMVLPRPVRELLGIADGGTVVVSTDGETVTLTPISASIRRAQALYRKHAKTDLTTDEFLAERRAEAAREAGG